MARLKHWSEYLRSYAIAYEPISLYVARMSMTDAVPTLTLDETLAELVGMVIAAGLVDALELRGGTP